MQILVIHRYFWPDSPPYASLLREIGDHWANEGHNVSVFSTQPSYKIELDNVPRPWREKLGSLNVIRCRLLREKSRASWLRALNSLLFAWKIFWHLLVHGKKYDLVMCSTVPPVLTGIATSLGCNLRNAKFVYHAMDIWPEVAAVSGQMKMNAAYRFLRWLDTWSCRLADAIVCLSDDMKATYVERDHLLKTKLHVINNFELPVYESEESEPFDLTALQRDAKKFRVLFAGNIGRYQGLEAVIQAASLVEDDSIEFVLLGDGSAKQQLISEAQKSGSLGRNVFFVSHQPANIAKLWMRDADVCLVTLAPGVSKVAYPSKTLTLLASSCPLAVMVEPESELSQTVTNHALGIAVPCNDAARLAAEVDHLARASDRLEVIRENVIRYAELHATSEAVLPLWDQLIAFLFPEQGCTRDRSEAVVSDEAFASQVVAQEARDD